MNTDTDHNKFITCDVECLPNYLLIMFRKVSCGELLYFEKFNDCELNVKHILSILKHYTIITFNGNKYDVLIIEAAIAGLTNSSTYKLSQNIINDKMQPWQIRKQMNIAALQIDHIDLIEVAPLQASLKIYAGRLHVREMMDMPIHHSEIIKKHQLSIMRAYCTLDLIDTEKLFLSLKSEIELRVSMSEEYEIDLRSKSDAQIAEAVIKRELDIRYDIQAVRQTVDQGTQFRYRPPDYISFQTDVLKNVLKQYASLPFTVESSGYLSFNFEMTEADRIKSGKNKDKMPGSKTKLKFKIGNTTYTVGIGGVHSNEKKIRHIADKNYIIRDYDVASYYPFIILNNKLAPRHLGEPFLKIYKYIVERRLSAKKKAKKCKVCGDYKGAAYWSVINEALKIIINGIFGKLGSVWSCLYAPDLLMQVTITGQLSLLMLVERLEQAGISIISVNTDGIVTKIPRGLKSVAEDVVFEWEIDTGYTTEGIDYRSINSRDVNNYIAVTETGVKSKGAYADQNDPFYRLRKNPANEICAQAVKEYLRNNTPVEQTIRACKDVNQFISIRTVNGGAVKGTTKIGKAIRWYYGADELDAIYYSTSRNKVPRSDGAVPIMKLPEKLPDDLDFHWYINEASNMLQQIGCR